ncbi:MAG: hypothetical protein SFW62_01280 [Alphaproteobacteria bacterium]|nr:hypothetical protein [Alphaproteobacteria bacterium]
MDNSSLSTHILQENALDYSFPLFNFQFCLYKKLMPPFESEIYRQMRRLFGDGLDDDLRNVLDTFVDPDDRKVVYSKIAGAVKLAAEIRTRRIKENRKTAGTASTEAKDPYASLLHANPLGITKIYAELLDAERRTPTEADLNIGIATILYRVLRLTRASEASEPDLSQAPLIGKYLDQIGNDFGRDVQNLVRATLQLSEINLPPRHVTTLHVGDGHADVQDERSHLSSFHRMVLERFSENKDVIKIRGSEFLGYAHGLEPDDPRRERCMYLLENVYIPIVDLCGLGMLRDRMQDQLLKMREPAAYQAIQDEIASIENEFLLSMGKERVTDKGARQRIICEHLKEKVQAALPDDLREPADITIEARPKTAYSIHLKKKASQETWMIFSERGSL